MIKPGFAQQRTAEVIMQVVNHGISHNQKA